MTAIAIIQSLMDKSSTGLSELAEYSDLGSKSNICQMLSRTDLKVSTFVKMLEVLGYQLIVQNPENEEDIVVDYEEV